MKDSTSLLLLAGAIVLTGIVGNIVSAEPAVSAVVAHDRSAIAHPHHAALLARYDVNRDGRLDATERAVVRADVAAGKLSAPWRHHRPTPAGHDLAG